MAAISASMVKELRERTGLGMMECKKALVEADGNLELAIENLRKSSGMKAAKKAGRVAADGVVRVAVNGSQGTLLEVNSETDFVARDDNFSAFADKVIAKASLAASTDVDTLMEGELEDARSALVQKIGENITVRRIEKISASVVGVYVHSNEKIGVMIGLDGGSQELAKDIAMHVAASNPIAIDKDGINKEVVDKELEIIKAEILNSGKPEEIAEKISKGKISKFLNDNSLLNQVWIMDPKKKVSDVLKEYSLNKPIKVLKFKRYKVGEGV